MPPNMFGPVPEDFYSLVGRIALVAALLENRLHVLLCALASEPEEKRAGEPGTKLIRACRRHVDAWPTDRQSEARAVLDDAEAALLRRHEVVHSLWPFGGLDETKGWRLVAPGRRSEPGQPVAWTSMAADELPGLLNDLLDVYARCRLLEAFVQH
jgi:hypothetical protein